MAAVRQRELPQDRDAVAIVKTLADLTYGRRQDQVFDDWLGLTEIYLRRLPANALHIVQHGRPCPDDGPDTAEWQRIAKQYKPPELEVMHRAMLMLMDAAEQDLGVLHGANPAKLSLPVYRDLLGDIYMAWGWPNAGTGQFFTPMSVASACAKTTLIDIDHECRQRVAAAIDASPMGLVGMLRGESVTQPGKEHIMLQVLPNVYPWLEPVTVSDPACGSGVMLLAAAAECPVWALDYAVVQFFGQDIDRTCVLMAKINLMIYGLNGYRIKLTAAARGVTPTGEYVGPQRQVPTPAPVVEPAQPSVRLPSARDMAQLELFGREAIHAAA
jgi:hypothetical protein